MDETRRRMNLAEEIVRAYGREMGEHFLAAHVTGRLRMDRAMPTPIWSLPSCRMPPSKRSMFTWCSTESRSNAMYSPLSGCYVPPKSFISRFVR